ncbi:MAG: TonB-dependent receptor [Deltaproteobacteria bacterium]|nr:TonB-dependent receptor [Deltaproteobacteria bacterium]
MLGLALGLSAVNISIADEVTSLGEVTVTGTREEEPIAETPAAIGTVSGKDVARLKPAHPSEIARRVPGVHVNSTSGEGHLTAIRQPLTTGPVYLFLEDGIPSRSTGFFNHNALYELNVPQSDGIEISKGPGTALYGSDAIGGVINVLTRPAPLTPELEATVEGGSYGWYRALISGGNTWNDNGLRTDLNITHTDGWRDSTEYDRQSATVRVDSVLKNNASLKTVLSSSNIDQQTAGSSQLDINDYLNNPRANYTPISFRKVQALRFSTAYEKETRDTLISLTPYARYDSMEILPNWSLSYDPQLYTTENKSIGLLAKYRKDFEPMRARFIAGIDIDYSPGSLYEQALTTTKTGKVFTAYRIAGENYDYDVRFLGISPYVHTEISPVEKLRLQAGLRYDHVGYDYENNLSVVTAGAHRRPASSTVDFDHLSPKIGLTYEFTPTVNGFASYRHAFRVPSESQLFRQGQAEDTIGLKPVKANSYEAGVRGEAFKGVSYEVSAYYMNVKDDVLTFKNTLTGTQETVNAGETLHRGVEVALGAGITDTVRLDVSYSIAKHTFEQWSPKTGVDLSGNEMSSAPREIASTRVSYSPAALNGGKLELEWERLGGYWMDDDNTHRYSGHNLLNAWVNYFKGDWELFARALNITDVKYSSRASFTQARGEEFAPGSPLTIYAGLSYKFF